MATVRSNSPPPRKSPWPWTRTRRNSESQLPSLRELVTGRRNSLSAGDSTQTAVLRKKALVAAELSTNSSQTPDHRSTDHNGAAVSPGPAKNGRRPQSQSR
jgi:hypothetical protein